jgi:hypothetical protein
VVSVQKEEITNINKTILVIGATGRLGKPVAQQPKVDGFNVEEIKCNLPSQERSRHLGGRRKPGRIERAGTVSRPTEWLRAAAGRARLK